MKILVMLISNVKNFLAYLKSSLITLKKSHIGLAGVSIFALALLVAPISAEYAASNNDSTNVNNSDFVENLSSNTAQEKPLDDSQTKIEANKNTSEESDQVASQTGTASSTVRTQVSVKSSTTGNNTEQSTTEIESNGDGHRVSVSTVTSDDVVCEDDYDGSDFEIKCESDETDIKWDYRCRGCND